MSKSTDEEIIEIMRQAGRQCCRSLGAGWPPKDIGEAMSRAELAAARPLIERQLLEEMREEAMYSRQSPIIFLDAFIAEREKAHD